MEQKFLDSEGVKHLWSKVNTQDYPNNEMLIGVINAIDETKADKTEIVQSDWSQNDNTQLNYIQNRTHGIIKNEKTVFYGICKNSTQIFDEPLILGQKYTIIIAGQNNIYNYTYEFRYQQYTSAIGAEFYYLGKAPISSGDPYFSIYIDGSNTGTYVFYFEDEYFPEEEYEITIFTLENSILQLSEEYIPNTIARTTDLTATLTEAYSYTDTAVAALVNSAPETLDTLGELAVAFEENADMVTILDAAVTNKAEKSDLDNLAELVDINAISIISLQNELFNLIYPIGAIYLSVTEVSPSTLFGGTWEQIKDTFLLAAGDIYNNEETGGEATHTLTIAEMPSHSHKLKTDIDSTDYNETWPEYYEYNEGWIQGPNSTTEAPPTHTTFTGNGEAHNNMPPYLTVYMWKRIV